MATRYDGTQFIARVGIAADYSVVPFGVEYETTHLKLPCEDLLPLLSISQYPATLFVAS